MQKFSLKALVVSFALLTINGVAHAGGSMDSGGGKGVVCRDLQKRVKSVELLDLWEARTLYNRKIKILGPDLPSRTQGALLALKDSIQPSGDGVLFLLQGKLKPFGYFSKPDSNVHLMTGISLTLTNDSYEDAKPEDCEIEQLIIYRDFAQGSEIWVNKDLVDMMDSTNKAALLVHEVFYSVLRDLDYETDSIRVRRAVGYVFSGDVFAPANLEGAQTIICSSAQPATSHNQIIFYKQPVATDYAALVTYIKNQHSVGYFPSIDSVSPSELQQSCLGQGDSEEVIPLRGTGPVDYDSTNSFITSCENGTRKFYLTQSLHLGDQTQWLPLACH